MTAQVNNEPATFVPVLHTIDEVRNRAVPHGLDRAVVLTMGALHEGHQALMRAATASGDVDLTVTIFVNPLQFTNASDLDSYPRSLESDVRLCAAAGVNTVFAPTVDVMYPAESKNLPQISAGLLGNTLEGQFRPHHFDGVLTVVNKFINILKPDVLYFGEKDFQQLVLIRHMVRALNIPVVVVGVPTVREADGLARSSRNVRLTPRARLQAAHIYAGLMLACHAWDEGADSAHTEHIVREYLLSQEGIEIDYVAVRSENLGAATIDQNARALIAVTIDGVRLIDNMRLTKGSA